METPTADGWRARLNPDEISHPLISPSSQPKVGAPHKFHTHGSSHGSSFGHLVNQPYNLNHKKDSVKKQCLRATEWFGCRVDEMMSDSDHRTTSCIWCYSAHILGHKCTFKLPMMHPHCFICRFFKLPKRYGSDVALPPTVCQQLHTLASDLNFHGCSPIRCSNSLSESYA